MSYYTGSSGDKIQIWHTELAIVEIQYRTNTHSSLGCIHNTGLTTTVHNLLTQPPILPVYEAHTIQYKKRMIRDIYNYSYIIHNTQCWT